MAGLGFCTRSCVELVLGECGNLDWDSTWSFPGWYWVYPIFKHPNKNQKNGYKLMSQKLMWPDVFYEKKSDGGLGPSPILGPPETLEIQPSKCGDLTINYINNWDVISLIYSLIYLIYNWEWNVGGCVWKWAISHINLPLGLADFSERKMRINHLIWRHPYSADTHLWLSQPSVENWLVS